MATEPTKSKGCEIISADVKHFNEWVTQTFIPITLKGGKAGASSQLGNHEANQAFFDVHKWQGAYLPWANLNTAKMPQTVWYHFPSKVTVGRFSFSSRSACCLEQSPLEFQFVGSDDCAHWQVIQSYKTQFTKMNEFKSWTIPVEARQSFACFGITVLKVKSGVYTAIKHFQMWAPEILIPAEFKGGKIGASSSLGGHGASQAFEIVQPKGVYLPWANLNTAKFPHTIWYQFPSAITVGKFAFSSRCRGWLNQSPVEFQFVASNDCKNWQVLGTFETKFTRLNEEKSWKVPCDTRSAFRCYGVRVSKVTSGIYTAIKHLKMWKTVLSEVLVPASLKGGNAGATSSLANHDASQAFVGNHKWQGRFLPWANLNTAKMPQTVWYQFPKAIQVARFAFSSRSVAGLEQAPTEFEFVGSNDCKNWNVIQTYKTQFTKLDQEKSWTIPSEARGYFKCYGIKVIKVKSGVYASLQLFKMWKSVEPKELIPVSYKGGKAGATSSLASHDASQAFVGNHKWKGRFLPWANLNTAKMPQTVWYQFPKAIQVARFAFSSRSVAGLEQAPVDFDFVGSNDCKEWRELGSYKTQFTKLDQEKSWTIPVESRGIYKCYGIKVNKVKSGVYTSIQLIKMWT